MAFLRPSGRMSVFTFAHLTSYIAFTASLILGLLALTSTRKTSVLISSIFFMADSVVTGHWIIRYLSILLRRSTDLRGYLGSRFFLSVLGLKKCTLVRIFFAFRETDAFTAFATLLAFLAPPPFPFSAPPSTTFFSAFGAIPFSTRSQREANVDAT